MTFSRPVINQAACAIYLCHKINMDTDIWLRCPWQTNGTKPVENMLKNSKKFLHYTLAISCQFNKTQYHSLIIVVRQTELNLQKIKDGGSRMHLLARTYYS